MEVPAAEGKLRFWRHTSIANLAPGQIATLPEGTLGYEWDEDVDNGWRPPGSFQVSSTTRQNMPVLQDFGSNYASGTAVHNMTLYRAPSGARVFGAGTVQWSWGLDSSHDRGSAPADARMQQATANLFADMGAHGATLQSELTSPSCSSDATGPTAQITSQGAGTAQGTAADTGGGRVAGVEVSTDGGSTWHPAEGRESWRYTWSPGHHRQRPRPRRRRQRQSRPGAVACDPRLLRRRRPAERRRLAGRRLARRRPVRLKQRQAAAQATRLHHRATRARLSRRPGDAADQVLGRQDGVQGAPAAPARRSHARRTARRHQRRRSATRPPLREPLRAAQARAQGRASSDRGGVGTRWGRPPHSDKNTRSGCWRRGGADGEVHVNEE